MLVRVLGPLAVGDVGPPLSVRPPRAARVLARLSVDAPRYVSVDALIDAVWGDGQLPARPERALHDAAADLRRFLRQFPGSKGIDTRPDGRGYRLSITEDELDASVAASRLKAATDAFDRAAWGDATIRFDAVLQLFRGDPYEEFSDEEFAVFEIDRLRTVLLDAQEGRLLALAAQGDHSFLGEAAHLAPRHPSRWRIWAAWMHALHVQGRQAEALDVYRRARGHLAEIGLEPPRELRELDRRIAIDDPMLGIDAWLPGPTAGPVPATLESVARQLVGRVDELDELDAYWSRVGTGATAVVTLLGEEGIGKTSVVSAFAHRVARGGGTVLAGRCLPELTAAYQPLTEAIDGHLRTLGGAQRDALLHGRAGAALATLLDRTADVPAELPSPDALAAAQHRLFQGVAHVIAELAAPRPVLLVLEDLHWADRSTVDLIRYLVRTTSSVKVMMLMTARDDEVGDDHPLRDVLQELVRHPVHTDVRLAGFDTTTVEDYLGAVWPELDQPLGLVEPLRASTEGNPLFLGEIIHELRDHPTSSITETIAVLTSSLVPAGIREITNRRIAKLSPGVRRVLSVAAVMGPRFSIPALLSVGELGGREGVLDALEQSVEAGVLEDSTAAGEMSFRHQYFRDVTYQRLLGPRRADLHYQVAQALDRGPGRASPRVIAHHLLEAGAMGDVDRAIDASLAAARQAASQLDAADAAALLRRALAIFDQDQIDAVRRCEVVLLLAQLLVRSGDFVGAKAVATQAWHLAYAVGDESKMVSAAVEASRFGTRSGADPAAIEMLERTLPLTTSDEHRAQVMARLAYHIGAFGDDSPRAERLARDALAVAERTGDTTSVVRAVWAVGIATLGHPNAAERATCGHRLIEAAERSGDEATLANGLRLVALASLELGDGDEFDRSVDRLDDLAAEVSSWVYAVDVARWRAMRAQLVGDWEGAAHHLERHGRFGGEKGVFTISHAGQQLFLARELGDATAVRALTEQIRARAPMFDILRGVMALLEAEEGHRASALEHFGALTEAGPSHFLNRTYPMNVALLIETALRLDVSPSWLESEMERYAGTLVICSWGEGCVGAADRFVAMARAQRGEYETVDELFTAAAELEARVGALPLLARTCYWRARTAIRRDGDLTDAAARHLAEGRALAVGVGLQHVVDACDDLQRQAGIPASKRT